MAKKLVTFEDLKEALLIDLAAAKKTIEKAKGLTDLYRFDTLISKKTDKLFDKYEVQEEEDV